MKNPKKLKRRHKMLLKEMGYHPEDFLLERESDWEYTFYNIHTKTLFPMLKN